nr:ethylene-responsive transcription factor ERF109-like [Ipomoea trifida]
MNRIGRRLKQERSSGDQGHRTPARLTGDQEFSVMVSALKNVISGNAVTAEENVDLFSSFEFLAAATAGDSSTSAAAELPPFLSVPEGNTCQFCGISGCLGCNFFGPTEAGEDKKNNKNVGTSSNENELWKFGEDEVQNCWTMMMDFNGDSSDSAGGYVQPSDHQSC